jgi:glycosyltransferase involved in cell wall biosynthesis
MSEDLDVPTDCPQKVEGVEVWYFRKTELLKKLRFFPYFSKSMGYLYSRAMAKELHRLVPLVDAVHTHLPFIYPTFAAAQSARTHRKPLFYHQRGVLDPARLDFRSLKKRVYLEAIEIPILRSATTLIALTDAEVQSYRRFCPSANCSVIPNGIDVDQYYSGQSPAPVLDLPAEARMILFLGRLHPIKGADKLIEAFVQVSKHIPDAVLVMAGPDEFRIESRFRATVAECGLQNRVLFPGMVTGEFKKRLLARANLFCLPSVAEGFSMAILEALASETAVLISPGCHFPEVQQSGAGVIAETEPQAMGEAMIQVLSSEERLKEMGGKGREFVRRNYSWDKITTEVMNVYSEGIERHQRRRGAAAS